VGEESLEYLKMTQNKKSVGGHLKHLGEHGRIILQWMLKRDVILQENVNKMAPPQKKAEIFVD
jgi:hypothetical protein